MTSTIRALLTEAPEEMTVAKQPTAAAPTAAGEKMSANDFAPAPPAGATPGLAPLPNLNTGQAGPATIQKEVLSKHQIISVVREVKAAVANFEKQFESEDFTVEDAKIYIHNFLESLAFFADKIANFIGEDMGGEVAPEATPDLAPAPEPLAAPAPEAEPFAEPVQTGEISPELSEPVSLEPSPFTNPTEAI